MLLHLLIRNVLGNLYSIEKNKWKEVLTPTSKIFISAISVLFKILI